MNVDDAPPHLRSVQPDSGKSSAAKNAANPEQEAATTQAPEKAEAIAEVARTAVAAGATPQLPGEDESHPRAPEPSTTKSANEDDAVTPEPEPPAVQAIENKEGVTDSAPPTAPVGLSSQGPDAEGQQAQVSEPNTGKSPEKDGNQQPTEPLHQPDIRSTAMTGSLEPTQRPVPRSIKRAFAAGIALLIGGYAWMQWPRQPEQKSAPPVVTTQSSPAGTSENQPARQVRTHPAPVLERQVTAQPSRAPQPPTPVQTPPTVVETQPPAEANPTPPVTPTVQEQPNPQPKQAERPTQEVKRQQDPVIAERLARFDAEQRRGEEEAIQRDRNPMADGRQQAQEQDARIAAGMGFRLRENMAPTGGNYSARLTETVEQCVEACDREHCDAFGFNRDPLRGLHEPRTCNLYRKPFSPSNAPGFVLGERVAEGMLGERKDDASERPTRLVQSGPPTAIAPTTEGIVRCSGIPVKVAGFKLTCDQLLGGGATITAGRVSYSVAHINQCAEHCRTNMQCAGFRYNAGDPDGAHACTLVGRGGEMHDGLGWIAGERQ
jgi:hypothetical protein